MAKTHKKMAKRLSRKKQAAKKRLQGFQELHQYEGKFETIQQAHGFSAMLFGNFFDLIWETKNSIGLRILVTNYKEGAGVSIDHNGDDYCIINGEVEPTIQLQIAFFNNSKGNKKIVDELNQLFQDKEYSKINIHNLGLKVDKYAFFNNPIGSTYDPKFKIDPNFEIDFNGSRMVKSEFLISKNKKFEISTYFFLNKKRFKELCDSGEESKCIIVPDSLLPVKKYRYGYAIEKDQLYKLANDEDKK